MVQDKKRTLVTRPRKLSVPSGLVINKKDIGCLGSKWTRARFLYGARLQLGSGSNSVISAASVAVF